MPPKSSHTGACTTTSWPSTSSASSNGSAPGGAPSSGAGSQPLRHRARRAAGVERAVAGARPALRARAARRPCAGARRRRSPARARAMRRRSLPGLVEAHERVHLRDGVERGVGGDVERGGAGALRAHLHQRAQQRARAAAHHGAAALAHQRGLGGDRVPRRPGHEAMHAVGDVGAAERGAADVGDVRADAQRIGRGLADELVAPGRQPHLGAVALAVGEDLDGQHLAARRRAPRRSRSARTCRPPSRRSRAPARRRPGAPRSCAARRAARRRARPARRRLRARARPARRRTPWPS